MNKGKVEFFLKVASGGGFSARGVDVPIAANARNLRDLRVKLAAATRTFFGEEKPLAILVGSPSLPVEPPAASTEAERPANQGM
jgi:hypothetical protein